MVSQHALAYYSGLYFSAASEMFIALSFYLRFNFPTSISILKTTKFASTMLAPTGRLKLYELYNPAKKHTTDTMPEIKTTYLNPLTTAPAESAGNMIRLEISIVPIILIPTTIVSAVKTAISIL